MVSSWPYSRFVNWRNKRFRWRRLVAFWMAFSLTQFRPATKDWLVQFKIKIDTTSKTPWLEASHVLLYLVFYIGMVDNISILLSNSFSCCRFSIQFHEESFQHVVNSICAILWCSMFNDVRVKRVLSSAHRCNQIPMFQGISWCWLNGCGEWVWHPLYKPSSTTSRDYWKIVPNEHVHAVLALVYIKPNGDNTKESQHPAIAFATAKQTSTMKFLVRKFRSGLISRRTLLLST